MEKKVKHKEEAFLQHPALFIAVLVLGLFFMDPFEIGPVGGIEFRPVKHDIAPYKEVMGSWPRDNESRLGNGKLEFVDKVFGPESLEFNKFGHGPYTGLADGRIVRWMGQGIGWETFVIFTSNWFNKDSGDLYIADANYGPLVVGSGGGLATPLATHVAGKPILFANDLDIHKNGSIFFTDTSRKYNRVYHFFILLEGETTGRILRYDPPTKTTHVVLDGLAFPNGIQLMKYWLEGPRTGTTELNSSTRDSGSQSMDEELILQITHEDEDFSKNDGDEDVHGDLTVQENGEIVKVLEDRKGVVMKLVSEVREVEGKLWIGTVAHNHIATLSYP
ncbi:Protein STRICTOSIDINE SYNTHASE-LIKE 13 [Hibiscus syriacus]|uniref:Protein STRICTOSIDINE SYNTHASE-LIKE 13 n=1 Tax=Hibiscus syriacus TaxID=106335 RepID=A0A6A2WHF0_HIBSY|nr:Protein STRICTOSIDINE SYNTHASE-LIKE 13 [Hibiscus syriacus]